MYTLVLAKGYVRSYRKLRYSGNFTIKAKEDLEFAINTLLLGNKLPLEYRDHQLSGELKGYRDCHIKGNLLLIYQIRSKELILILANIGTHSELF